MVKNKPITRVCSACGTEKPLSAFLHLGGPQGRYYGTVCATCRASGILPKHQKTHGDDDTTTVRSGERLGAKEKFHTLREKNKQFHDVKELLIREGKRREELKNKRNEAELKDELLKDKLERVTDAPKKVPDVEKTIKSDKEIQREFLAQRQREDDKLVEVVKQEDLVRQELQTNSFDFSTTTIAGQTNQIKYQSETFLNFKSWIGGSSAVVNNLDKLYGKKNLNAPVVGKKNESMDDKKLKENVEDYIEKRIGPGRKK